MKSREQAPSNAREIQGTRGVSRGEERGAAREVSGLMKSTVSQKPPGERVPRGKGTGNPIPVLRLFSGALLKCQYISNSLEGHHGRLKK